MGDIGKERRRIEVLPTREPAAPNREPAAPATQPTPQQVPERQPVPAP